MDVLALAERFVYFLASVALVAAVRGLFVVLALAEALYFLCPQQRTDPGSRADAPPPSGA